MGIITGATLIPSPSEEEVGRGRRLSGTEVDDFAGAIAVVESKAHIAEDKEVGDGGGGLFFFLFRRLVLLLPLLESGLSPLFRTSSSVGKRV